MHLVHRRPRAPFGFGLGDVALLIDLLDVLGMPLLLVGVLLFATAWHNQLLRNPADDRRKLSAKSGMAAPHGRDARVSRWKSRSWGACEVLGRPRKGRLAYGGANPRARWRSARLGPVDRERRRGVARLDAAGVGCGRGALLRSSSDLRRLSRVECAARTSARAALS